MHHNSNTCYCKNHLHCVFYSLYCLLWQHSIFHRIVIEQYIDGILYEMAPQDVRDYSAEGHEVFKYSSNKDYEKIHATLLTKCKDMKLRS